MCLPCDGLNSPHGDPGTKTLMKTTCQKLVLLALLSLSLVSPSDLPPSDEDDEPHSKRIKITESEYVAVTSTEQQVGEQTNVAAGNIYDFDQAEENQPEMDQVDSDNDLYSGMDLEKQDVNVTEQVIHPVIPHFTTRGVNWNSGKGVNVANYGSKVHGENFFAKKKPRTKSKTAFCNLPTSDSELSTNSKASKSSRTSVRSVNSVGSRTGRWAPTRHDVDINSGGSTPLVGEWRESEEEKQNEDMDQVDQDFEEFNLELATHHEGEYDGASESGSDFESDFETDDQSHV